MPPSRDIIINYGLDVLQITYEALAEAGLASLIRDAASVTLKPNLVMAKHPSQGATTHAEVIEAIIIYLRENGIKDITIAESAWVGGNTKQAFEVCGYNKLSEKYNIPLIDLKDKKSKTVDIDGFKLNICDMARDSFLINVPVLKAHCQTKLTCNLKNLKGVIPDSEKRRFHSLGLHKPIAMLNKAVKTHFCVVDGICGDINFEEGGNPVKRDMVIAGRDPVMIDSYCANLLGYNVSEIDYLIHASEMKIGRLYDENTLILELNANKKPKAAANTSGIASGLSAYIDERAACSACYSGLICALHKNRRTFGEKIKIGQGFKGQTGVGIGVGNCACGFSKHIGGCPPKANDIADFLRSPNL